MMPRVKIDHIVSFSSEDPEAPASNLLATEVSKKKWLCAKGETSCSVVLQLVKAVKIVCVQIGVEHSALVEVLVGRSESPNQQYEVLVPSCVFVSVAESRRDAPVSRVRSFSGEQLASARNQKWDRVRVVCSQPYNKHCKYGLSFIHIFDDEEEPPTPAVDPSTEEVNVKNMAPLNLETYSSDDDDFKPGELFAKQKETKSSDTGAQIRQATFQMLRNVADAAFASSLVKAIPRNDTSKSRDSTISSNTDTKNSTNRDRRKTSHDTDRPKEKDRRKTFDECKEDKRDKDKNRDTFEREEKKRDTSKEKRKEKLEDERHRSKETKRDVEDEKNTSRHKDKEERRDRVASSSSKRSSDRDEHHRETSQRAGNKTQDGSTVLTGVIFAMSGYENPRRARVRDTALAMGARYRPDWGADCTHLICAFPNTPKLRKVRSSVGDTCIAVTAEWIEECAVACTKLPWHWFATEPGKREKGPPLNKTRLKRAPTPPSDDECDTDDEIDKVLHKQKRARVDSSPSTSGDVCRSPKDGVTSERTQNSADDEDKVPTDTEATIMEQPSESISDDRALPEIFSGMTFAIDGSVTAVGIDAKLLERYVRAYGGELVSQSVAAVLTHALKRHMPSSGRRQDWQSSEEDSSAASYTLAADPDDSGSGGGRRVRADWVWRCHRQRALVSPTPYLLTSSAK